MRKQGGNRIVGGEVYLNPERSYTGEGGGPRGRWGGVFRDAVGGDAVYVRFIP